MTKLNSGLPKGDGNGLGAISHDLVHEPHKIHVAVMLIDCKSITTDADSGDVTPTARIRRIEVIQQDKDIVAKLLRRAMEDRTGQVVLPFDLEEDLRGAFGNIDTNTGEISGDDSAI